MLCIIKIVMKFRCVDMWMHNKYIAIPLIMADFVQITGQCCYNMGSFLLWHAQEGEVLSVCYEFKVWLMLSVNHFFTVFIIALCWTVL